ncbi:hypothetical protein KUTeg_003836 [Tegillarca granosa]|uniref:Uncharacterized protein n=1 Tax=Tegillarca granosa TaxID=220873 RepID=A0ABQ9FR41_TEGGR|nr:hypothetical protein KUTeg_003836 [Tegillarca granosa]
MVEIHPLKKLAKLDVVNAVLFLLSDKASMITGSSLPVDGDANLINITIKMLKTLFPVLSNTWTPFSSPIVGSVLH